MSTISTKWFIGKRRLAERTISFTDQQPLWAIINHRKISIKLIPIHKTLGILTSKILIQILFETLSHVLSSRLSSNMRRDWKLQNWTQQKCLSDIFVLVIFLWAHKGESLGRGSTSNTSRTAPRKKLLSRAKRMSASLIMFPRPMLTKPTSLHCLRFSLKQEDNNVLISDHATQQCTCSISC